MEKSFCDRFQPRDYELLMILFRFITGMGCYNTNIRHEDLYGDKEPWELYRGDSDEKYQYFFTQLYRKSKSSSRFDRTVGKRGGTWHGQDKGKPIIHKGTGALLGYKRSFLYRNKQESEQDRQWLLKEFYLNNTVIMKARVEHIKDFVICRLQRKKRPHDKPQEIKNVPIETIMQILMKGAPDDSTATETLPTEEQKSSNYYSNSRDVEEILAQQTGVSSSMQVENNINDIGLLFNGGILNDDPQQSMQGVNNDNGLLFNMDGGILNEDHQLLSICMDNFEGFTKEILQELKPERN